MLSAPQVSRLPKAVATLAFIAVTVLAASRSAYLLRGRELEWNLGNFREVSLGKLTFVTASNHSNCRLEPKCFEDCDAGYASIFEVGMCMDLCCPEVVPPGTCMEWGGGSGWGCECPEGYNEPLPRDASWTSFGCPPLLCCSPGSPGSKSSPAFWYNKCFKECPVGFMSVYKSAPCWDLCIVAPDNPSYLFVNVTADDIRFGRVPLIEQPVHPAKFDVYGY